MWQSVIIWLEEPSMAGNSYNAYLLRTLSGGSDKIRKVYRIRHVIPACNLFISSVLHRYYGKNSNQCRLVIEPLICVFVYDLELENSFTRQHNTKVSLVTSKDFLPLSGLFVQTSITCYVTDKRQGQVQWAGRENLCSRIKRKSFLENVVVTWHCLADKDSS